MKKRKHRLVVEFTTSHPMTESAAARGLALILSEVDIQRKPIWAAFPDIYGEKLTIKRFSRVLAADKVKRRRKMFGPEVY